MKRRSKPKRPAKARAKKRVVARHSQKKSAKQSRKTRSAKRLSHKKSSSSRRVPKSESIRLEQLEQVTVTCPNCGREYSMVKISGISTEGMVCQRCQVGEQDLPEQL